MKITVFGFDYVGLVTSACMAEVGNSVLCIDHEPKKNSFLESDCIPYLEPGLMEMVKRNVAAGRLHFTTDVEKAVSHGKFQFITVVTPKGKICTEDLQYVIETSRTIGRNMEGYKIVVIKSTLPLVIADRVRDAIADELTTRDEPGFFSVISNPSNLKAGSAVEDFMRPDLIIVGANDERGRAHMIDLYSPFHTSSTPVITMNVTSAEMPLSLVN